MDLVRVEEAGQMVLAADVAAVEVAVVEVAVVALQEAARPWALAWVLAWALRVVRKRRSHQAIASSISAFQPKKVGSTLYIERSHHPRIGRGLFVHLGVIPD